MGETLHNLHPLEFGAWRVYACFNMGLSKPTIIFLIRALLLTTLTAALFWPRSLASTTESELTIGELTDKAKSLIESDDLREAAHLLEAAIDLVESQEGPGHEDLVELLDERADILNSLGRHNEALRLYERSLAIATERWGSDHPETAGPMLGIASVKNKRGEFSEAKTIYTRCLANLERTVGPAAPRTAEAARGLAVCLGNLADYGQAERIIRRCLEATIEAYGEHNGQAGDLMLTLAELLAMLGRQVESTRLYRRAAEVLQMAYGPAHTRTAAALSGLAHVERRMGNSLEAETLYRRAIEIVETRHGSPHPDLIHYRSRLGMCLLEYRKNSEKAISSVEAAIAEAAEIYGPDSYQVALEQRQLGLLLDYVGKREEAFTVLHRSLATLEKCFGPNHPYLSKCLKGLTSVCMNLNRLKEARTYIERAISLHEHASGRDQLELSFLLDRKSIIEVQAHMWDDAFESALRATRITQTVLEDIYQVTSTREALMYANRPKTSVSILVSAAAAHPGLPDSTWARVFSLLVRTHGQVLDRLAERHKYLELAADDPVVERAREEYAAATQRVADLTLAGPTVDERAYREALAGARREREESERALSAALERLRRVAAPQSDAAEISVGAMAAVLNPGDMLIHFVHFARRPISGVANAVRPAARYGAFRLSKVGAHSWDLDFVDLGNEAFMDSSIFAYRRTIDGLEPGRRPSARDEAEYRLAARQLHERLWEPLVSAQYDAASRSAAAGRTPTVFLVPVSWFHLVDFNTLLSLRGDLVIERWKVHLLSSGQDLLRRPDRPRGRGLLAVGNPTYVSPASESGAGVRETGRRISPVHCVEADVVVSPLPGAEDETRSVARLFSSATGEPVEALLGLEGTEEAVKELLPGKRMAHFATHGFFCEEEERVAILSASRLLDPLLMSGLVLAAGPGEGDGLLTAEELICLDLRDLDWVVLSACGSGLGRLVDGEGLFGLRRAFEIAGARTVVMALWRISDVGTRQLMEQIYRRRLAGSPTIDAIREAQLERLHDERRRLNRIHPALWGGIIAEGDWR